MDKLKSKLKSVAMEPERNCYNQLKSDFFKWLLATVPIAHSYTDRHEARKARGQILYDHSCMVSEICNCHVCTVITAAYDDESHNWRFCRNQFECMLCYNLVEETMQLSWFLLRLYLAC